MRIFLSTGEASGEQYAVQLIQTIRRQAPQAEFFGLGGQRMASLGFHRIVRAEDVAVMGITEILRHIPRIYREYRRLKHSLTTHHPDVAVLIDFPDVNLSLSRECKRLRIPVIFFVSPQVWAWKKHRLPQIRSNVDQMLVIFPFEEPFYRNHGIQATFVGHPLTELPLPSISRESFAAQQALDPQKPWVALLPGSRPKEIALNLPTMIRAAALLARDRNYEWLLPLAPTLTPAHITSITHQLHELGATVRDPTIALTTQPTPTPQITLTQDARATLHHARAAIVASGTATVEAALIGTPFLVVYRVSPLTYAIAKRVVQVPHVAMVNLVAGRRAVPELIQHDFTPTNVANTLHLLLNDEPIRQTMQAELRRVATLLTAPGPSPIDSLAAATLAAATVSKTSMHS